MEANNGSSLTFITEDEVKFKEFSPNIFDEMKHFDQELDHLAAQFSKELATTEQQLMALGAAHLPTSDLLRLQGKYSERIESYLLWQKRFLSLAMWSPLLLVIGALLFWLGLLKLALLILSAFPVSLVIAGWGIYSLYNNYGTLNQHEELLDTIEEELRKRKYSAKK